MRFRRAPLWLALVFAALGAGRAWAAPATILYLTARDGTDRDAEGIRQAVAIYTRDLRVTLESRPLAPTSVTAESLGEVAELVRASGARLAFWCERRPVERDAVLYTVAIDQGRPIARGLPIAGSEGVELYRSAALKLRAVLAGAAVVEEAVPMPAIAPRPPAPLSPEPGPPPAPPAPPAPAPAAAAADRPASERQPRDARLLLGVGYRLVLPSDPSLLRQGIAVEAARPLRPFFELHLGTEVTSEARRQISTGEASLFDLPIRIGARMTRAAASVTLAVGPCASLHVISVSAIGFDATRGDALTAVAGLGGDAVGRVRVADRLAAEVHLVIEAIVPATTFALHGRPSLKTGSAMLGIGAGLSFDAL